MKDFLTLMPEEQTERQNEFQSLSEWIARYHASKKQWENHAWFNVYIKPGRKSFFCPVFAYQSIDLCKKGAIKVYKTENIKSAGKIKGWLLWDMQPMVWNHRSGPHQWDMIVVALPRKGTRRVCDRPPWRSERHSISPTPVPLPSRCFINYYVWDYSNSSFMALQ